jgi:hypothetical protein
MATMQSLASVVADEILRIRREYDIVPAQFAIITRHTRERDLLLASPMTLPLARWNQRDEESIVCETIHRTKGLERLAVIYVDLDESRSEQLEYIGSSRAMLHLVAVVAE